MMLTRTPKDVIDDRLPELPYPDIPEERAGSNTLRFVFVGNLQRWSNFHSDLSYFYDCDEIQEAFEKTQETYIDWNPLFGSSASCDTNVLQSTRKVSDESTLSEKFIENVLSRVESVAKTLAKSCDMKGFLPADFDHGSPFTINRNKRKTAPDVVFKIPASGRDRKICFIGELKYSKTCDMSKKWDDLTSETYQSMRHIFGQVARDMLKYRVRYGFVSTYEETVFLKIHKNKDRNAELHYSPRVLHAHTVTTKHVGRLDRPNMRLCLLYLLHLASRPNLSDWSLEGVDINPEEWTQERTSTAMGPVGSGAITPRTPLLPRPRRNPPSIVRGINMAAMGRNTSQRNDTTPSKPTKPDGLRGVARNTSVSSNSLRQQLPNLPGMSSNFITKVDKRTSTAVSNLFLSGIRDRAVAESAKSAVPRSDNSNSAEPFSASTTARRSVSELRDVLEANIKPFAPSGVAQPAPTSRTSDLIGDNSAAPTTRPGMAAKNRSASSKQGRKSIDGQH